MTTHIDFRTMPANVPVLCIPRVYPNISESHIRRIFEDLDMGVLERIDIVSKHSEKGEKFNRVFVHFRRWNDTENANIARERLLNGKEIKIIYDDPWFWKISAYREAERKPSAPQNAGQRKPTLQFDSDEDRASNLTSYREPRRQDDRRRPDESKARGEPFGRRDDRRRSDDRRRPDDSKAWGEPFGRRDDSRERRRPDKREEDKKPAHEPRTPSCSPQRERVDNENTHVDQGLKIDYGDITIPFRKKRNYTTPATGVAKKTLKIEDEKEDREVVENI